MIKEDFLFTEKYRPKTVQDTILPQQLKDIFQGYVDQKNIPTLLLSGPPGIGKTSVAIAMLTELDCDWIMVNGSLEGRTIDTLRTTITDFASTVSFSDGRKYVIVDEADYMNPNSVQPALRNFIEEYAGNCGFIFTVNHKNKILPAIQSRCSIVDFKITKKEFEECAKQFFKRTCEILAKENIEYDKKVVVEVIKKYYPDWRRVLNELQKYSATGKIDSGILVDLKDVSLQQVCEAMKKKDFAGVRKWVSDNSDIDSISLFQSFYDHAHVYLKKTSIPILILLLAKYQYQAAFVANHEINTMSFFVELMTEVEFE